MQLNIQKITPHILGKIEDKLLGLRSKGIDLESLNDDLLVRVVVGFLHHLKRRNKHVIEVLRDVGVLDKDERDSFEGKMYAIARHDLLDNLVKPEKRTIKDGSFRLEKYIAAVFGTHTDYSEKKATRAVYARHRRNLSLRADRIQKDKNVNELAKKYPHLDVHAITTYLCISDKMDYKVEDLVWLSGLLDIISTQKSANTLQQQ
jgi:hypothetical protein